MTIKERMEAIRKLECEAGAPFDIERAIGKVGLFGSQVCFGQDLDYMTIEEMQLVTLWMVEQFGLPGGDSAKKLAADKRRKQK